MTRYAVLCDVLLLLLLLRLLLMVRIIHFLAGCEKNITSHHEKKKKKKKGKKTSDAGSGALNNDMMVLGLQLRIKHPDWKEVKEGVVEEEEGASGLDHGYQQIKQLKF